MNLGSFLAQKAYDAIGTKKYLDRIRAEHDAWARTAQVPGIYYTAAPTSVYEDFTNRKIHNRYEFVKQGTGIWVNQLLTDRGASSWHAWREHGPLTNRKMLTAADCRAQDDQAFAGFTQRAHDEIGAAVYAELRDLYPASAQLLVAA